MFKCTFSFISMINETKRVRVMGEKENKGGGDYKGRGGRAERKKKRDER